MGLKKTHTTIINKIKKFNILTIIDVNLTLSQICKNVLPYNTLYELENKTNIYRQKQE